MEPIAAAEATPLNVTHTSQIQLATILAAHYSATRASVDDWLRRRDQYLILYTTGTAVTFGAYMSKLNTSLILYLVPALTLVTLCAYVSADLHVAYLCKWLRVEYSSLLEKFVRTYGVISLTPWHWDNSASVAEFYAQGVGGVRYLFLWLTFILANTASLILARIPFGRLPVALLDSCVGAALISGGGLVAIYRKRRIMAECPVKSCQLGPTAHTSDFTPTRVQEEGAIAMMSSDQYEATVRAMITREDELTNQRMLWMAAFNGLLFAALGFAWDKSGACFLATVFALLGASASFLNGLALIFASKAQRRLLIWWQERKPNNYAGPGVMGCEPLDKRRYSLYVTPWILLSAIFTAGWLAILLLVLKEAK